MKRLLVLAVALTAACGSTVQVRGDLTGTDAGLGSEQSSTTGLTATGTGAAAPGAATTGGGTTTGSGGASAAPGSVPGTAPTTSATAPGAVTRQQSHEPIEIGFVTTSVGNAQSLGVNAGQTYSDKAMYDALVAEYNAAGGLAGHRIKPVYGQTDTASSNWSSQFAAVCETFTRDHKVKAVLGYVFIFLHNFESCLAKARVPHLSGGYQPGDIVDQQQYPTLIGTANPTVDGANLVAMQGALESGLLTAKTKLGLLIDTCANGDRAFKNSTEPWLKAHKVNYQVVTGACGNGASDASGAAATISNAELRFASSGVNLVFGNAIEILLFMAQAQSQGYHPQYLTYLGGAALEANAPASQMKNLHAFGWMPAVDVNPQQQPYPKTAAQSRCIAKLRKHGLNPTAYNDFMQAYVTCDGLDLYAQALASTGSTEATGIVRAVTSALPTVKGAATYGGAMQTSPRQRGGPATYRETAWADACSCMRYRGAVRPVPSP